MRDGLMDVADMGAGNQAESFRTGRSGRTAPKGEQDDLNPALALQWEER
jgi:hypothetical protein